MDAQLHKTLENLAADFFPATGLDPETKRRIFSAVQAGIEGQRPRLRDLVVSEVKLTPRDADLEISRAISTFKRASENADFTDETRMDIDAKQVRERRVARGPLLAITPFSSPLSSPAHKICLGLIAGTSVLFKPSPQAVHSGRALYEIINAATGGKFVYFTDEYNEAALNELVADDRIGIISFTGGYATGKKIIQQAGVKKYHMELTGGNSPVIFAPDFSDYTDQLASRLVEGIVAKNGQRCVSVKHIFIPTHRSEFIERLQTQLIQTPKLGPLITEAYAEQTEAKVQTILKRALNPRPLIPLNRTGDYIAPALYLIPEFTPDFVQYVLGFDLPGPVVFVHLYEGPKQYEQILDVLKRDYIRSGLQLSVYVTNEKSARDAAKELWWGGIIFNDIPTFRDDVMSFGGFGKSGLGKEGFLETARAYTDPQTTVYPSHF